MYDAFGHTPLNIKMYNLVKKIKKTYKTALITDNYKDRMDILIIKHKLNKIFNSIVISAEIGSSKRENSIFKRTLDELQVLPEECIFIDNHKENIKIPGEMGMNTIYYHHETDNAESLKKKLEDFNLE